MLPTKLKIWGEKKKITYNSTFYGNHPYIEKSYLWCLTYASLNAKTSLPKQLHKLQNNT